MSSSEANTDRPRPHAGSRRARKVAHIRAPKSLLEGSCATHPRTTKQDAWHRSDSHNSYKDTNHPYMPLRGSQNNSSCSLSWTAQWAQRNTTSLEDKVTTQHYKASTSVRDVRIVSMCMCVCVTRLMLIRTRILIFQKYIIRVRDDKLGTQEYATTLFS